jgi:hypothetical protein
MPTGKHRRPSTTDLPSSNVHPALVTRVCRDRAGPADLDDLEDRVGQDRVGLVVLENPAGLAALVGQEDTNPAAPVDTNRAALGGKADTGPADREGLASLGPVSPDPEDLEDMIRGLRAGRERAARGLRDRDLADRAAPDLGQNRAHLGRNPAHPRRNLPDPDPTLARLHRMRAHLHRTPAHLDRIQARPQEPTRLAAPTRLVAPTRLAAPTLPGTADSDADRPC